MKNIQREDTFRFSASDSAEHVMIPGLMGFKSAHTLINRERVLRERPSLNRSAFLDGLCQVQVHKMAERCELLHSAKTTDELKDIVNSEHAGENVHRGRCVVAMHEEAMMAGKSAYQNILGKKFREFGVATCMGKDGKLYMAQLFRGRVREEDEDDEDGHSTGAKSDLKQVQVILPKMFHKENDMPGLLPVFSGCGDSASDSSTETEAFLFVCRPC